MTLKTRKALAFSGSGTHYTLNSALVWVPSGAFTALGLNYRSINSPGHRGWRNLQKAKGDIGGNLVQYQADWINPGGEGIRAFGGFQPVLNPSRQYVGNVYAYSGNVDGKPGAYAWPTLASASTLNALGAKGVARALPTNPVAGLNQFFGELRQLPKRFNFAQWKLELESLRLRERSYKRNRARRKFKEAADDYLNLQFGWLPIVKDIGDFADATRNYSKYANRLERGSGKHIRRRRRVLKDESFSIASRTFTMDPILHTTYFGQGKSSQESTGTKITADFSGAFTYYLPPATERINALGQSKRDRRIREIVYGASIDAELLYNLAPWSWAVDWVSSLGDVIHNWNAFRNDDLVMHYGYLTYKIEKTISWITTPDWTNKANGPPVISQSVLLKTKQRVRANPYGFGKTPGSLTPKQWSILGALGISKGLGQLHPG